MVMLHDGVSLCLVTSPEPLDVGLQYYNSAYGNRILGWDFRGRVRVYGRFTVTERVYIGAVLILYVCCFCSLFPLDITCYDDYEE